MRRNDDPPNEDQEAEAFYDAMFDKLEMKLSEKDINDLSDWLWKQMGEAYSKGYQDGIAEEALANELEKQGKL